MAAPARAPVQGQALPPARAPVQALPPAQTHAPVRGRAPALNLSPRLPLVPAAAVLVAVALLLPGRVLLKEQNEAVHHRHHLLRKLPHLLGKLLQFQNLLFYMLTSLVGM